MFAHKERVIHGFLWLWVLISSSAYGPAHYSYIYGHSAKWKCAINDISHEKDEIWKVYILF